MKTHAQKIKAEFAVPKFQRAIERVKRHDRLTLLAAVAVMMASVALASCAGYTTNAADTTASQSGSGSGVLSASTATLDFGNVDLGSSSTQALSLTNMGTQAVSISGVTISGSGFGLIGGNYSGTVAAGQTVNVQLTFAPQSSGSISGDMDVANNTSASPDFRIKLHGNGTQPLVTLSPDALNFSNVTVGQTSAQNVTLTNAGTSNLQLKAATVSGNGFAISGLNMPETIPAGQNVTFSVQFTPTSTTAASGSVAFTDNAPGAPQQVILSGSAIAASGTLSANPGSYSFSNVTVGSSTQQTITLKNSGTAAVTINQISATGTGFSVSGISAGQSVAAGAQASFTAIFAPTAAGAASGAITIASNATNPTLSIALNGTGIQGALSANPTSVNFGSVLTGSSGSASVTLTNSGTAPVSVTAATVSGTGFSVTGFTAGTLNPGATSSFTVAFSPTAAGSASGTVSVTSNAPGSPLTIGLSGTGSATQSQLTISPSSVAFNNVNVGSNASQTVTLTNAGNAALNITTATVTGSGYTTTLAPMTVNAGAKATFSVTFAPTSEGTAQGSISISSNAPGSPAAIALSGTGLEALGSASPASVSFGSVTVGTSNSEVVTLKNTGNTTLTFSQVSVTGTGFSVSGLSTSTTVAAGATLNFNAVYAPASANSSSGSISLSTNGSPAQIAISLTGAGTAATQSLSLSPSSLGFGNVQVGSSSALTTTLTNTGNTNVTVSGVTVSGTGYTASGISSGLILSPNQTATLTVNFAPAGLGSAPGSVSIASNATNSPTTISLSGESHTVLLSWAASTSSGVTGYYVYRGTQQGQYAKIDAGSASSSTQFTDSAVQAATTYYYVVTAVNSSGVESAYSSPTTVSVP